MGMEGKELPLVANKDRLVSSGTDHCVKVWEVVHVEDSPCQLSLALICSVRSPLIPLSADLFHVSLLQLYWLQSMSLKYFRSNGELQSDN